MNQQRSLNGLPRRARTLVASLLIVLVHQTAGGQPPTGSGTHAPRSQDSLHLAARQPIESGQMLARVGNQIILASEVKWHVDRMLAENPRAAEIPPEMRELAMQVQLVSLLNMKLVINDLHSQVPQEGIENVEKQLAEPFEEQFLPKVMEQLSVSSRVELDARLRQQGSSLEQLRQGFLENRMYQVWLEQQVSSPPIITRDELYQAYLDRLDDYAYPAKARWQELMVRFDRFGGDRAAAWRALAEMGNQVIAHEAGQGGAPFEAVAKAHSHGFTAADGGLHDWTAQGSLVSKKTDDALFTLPIGGRSPILVTDDGLHIIQVLERKPAGRVPFEEAQAEIREKMIAQRQQKKQREYLEKLRKEVQIWTRYTGPTTVAEFASSVAAAANSP